MTETAPTSSLPVPAQTKKRWRGPRVLTIVEIVVLAAALAMPLILQDYQTGIATRMLILCLFALSFDLCWGYAGIMSFGHALFFGAAGYGVALLARDLNVTSVFLVLPAGALIGLVFSTLLGCFLLLGRNPATVIFVSLGTLTGSYAADRLARGWYYLGGQNGIPSLYMSAFGNDLNPGPVFYYMVLALLFVVYLGCRFLVRSQFGLALAGIRVNETRIAFFGYRVQRLKAIVFAGSGAIAGLSGSLYAFHENIVWPNMVGVVMSTQVVLYVLFGGAGTLIGAVIGTIAVETVTFWLSDSYQAIWPIILGAVLLLVILFRPAGLISLLVGERERVGSFGRPPKAGGHAAS